LDRLAVACGRRERWELSGDYYVGNYDEDCYIDYRVVETGGQTQWRKIFNFQNHIGFLQAKKMFFLY
jgi:hypothetical protein